MELIRLELTGRAGRAMVDDAAPRELVGVVGIDVAAREVDGQEFTVVQLLLDDDVAGFDRSMLNGPIVADYVDHDDVVMLREPFDHDAFRRQLHRERADGESTTRGVLVLTNGELPPPWVRLAFVPVPLPATDGGTLVVRRTTVAELNDGVEVAFSRGAITEIERRALLMSIEQRHPKD